MHDETSGQGKPSIESTAQTVSTQTAKWEPPVALGWLDSPNMVGAESCCQTDADCPDDYICENQRCWYIYGDNPRQ